MPPTPTTRLIMGTAIVPHVTAANDTLFVRIHLPNDAALTPPYPVMLFLPDMMCSAASYAWLAQRMAAHGFAAPIGGMFSAPHGAVCAALLPNVMAVNLQALRARSPGSETLKRYDEVARLVTGSDSASADDGVRWVAELVRDLQIPGLRAYGISSQHTDELVVKAAQASSMKANPIQLTTQELAAVLGAAL